MPPPSWIATLSPTAAIMSRITFSFFGRPAIAPFKSTMCRRFAPCAAQCLAIATGSSENTVAVLMSPCLRRTQRPSFKSIAGMMSTGPGTAARADRSERDRSERKSGTPPHEIGEKLQAGGLAFFGAELDGKNIIPGHRAGKGPPIHRGGGGKGRIARRWIVAMHEVEPARVRDAGPQRMRPRLRHLVPAHVRHLEPGQPEAGDLAAEQPEAGGVALLAMLEQHLQPNTDAEKGPRARRLDHRFARAACGELSHAVGHGSLARHHDPVGRKNVFGRSGDADLRLRRDPLDRLRDRTQVAHPVVDDRDPQATASPWWRAPRRPRAGRLPQPCAG